MRAAEKVRGFLASTTTKRAMQRTLIAYVLHVFLHLAGAVWFSGSRGQMVSLFLSPLRSWEVSSSLSCHWSFTWEYGCLVLVSWQSPPLGVVNRC